MTRKELQNYLNKFPEDKLVAVYCERMDQYYSLRPEDIKERKIDPYWELGDSTILIDCEG